MKRLLTILMMLCALNLSAQNSNDPKKDIRTMGYTLMGGGVTLTVIAVATPGELQRTDGRWEPMPLYRQDARFAGVVAGTALTATGLLSTLLSLEPKRRRHAGFNGSWR